MAEELLKQTKAKYDGILDIANELILVDARQVRSEGMTSLRNALKRIRKEIIVSYFNEVCTNHTFTIRFKTTLSHLL